MPAKDDPQDGGTTLERLWRAFRGIEGMVRSMQATQERAAHEDARRDRDIERLAGTVAKYVTDPDTGDHVVLRHLNKNFDVLDKTIREQVLDHDLPDRVKSLEKDRDDRAEAKKRTIWEFLAPMVGGVLGGLILFAILWFLTRGQG